MAVPSAQVPARALAGAVRTLDRIERQLAAISDPAAAWLAAREARAIEHLARLAHAHGVALYAALVHLRAYRRLGETLPPARAGRPQKKNLSDGKVLNDSIRHRARAVAAISAPVFAAYLDRYTPDGDREYPTRAGLLAEARRLALETERARAARDGAALRDASADHVLAGDFRDVLASVPAKSVRLILTDPPYDRASVPLFGALGALAARVLIPGGSLLSYAPAHALPEVLSLVNQHLRYAWILALRHAGPRARFHPLNVYVAWKPIVWWTAGDPLPADPCLHDLIEGTGREKDLHDWQQAESEAAYLVERLSSPGDTVLDPMCGSGTVLAAASRLGRHPLGCDLEPDHVASARDRLAHAS